MRAVSVPLSLTALAFLSFCPPRKTQLVVPPAPIPPLDLSSWILLAHPESTSRIGQAFDLVNADTGCYQFDSSTSAGLTRSAIFWSRASHDSVGLRVASILGLGYFGDEVDSGSIVFDTLMQAMALNVAPLATCNTIHADGRPARPAVTSELGARRYSFRLYHSASPGAEAQIKAKIKGLEVSIGGHIKPTESSSYEVTFDHDRWFGARFLGFERARTDTIRPGIKKLGMSSDIGQTDWSLIVNGAETPGSYNIRVYNRETASWDTIANLQDNGFFTFGRPPGAASVGGAYFTGSLYVMASTGEYQVFILSEANRQIPFATALSRDSLIGWASKRTR